MILWRYTKEHAPKDGVLSVVDAEDLAIISRISREQPERSMEFGELLIGLRLVDRLEDGRMKVHSWEEEQPHIVEAALGFPSAKVNGSKGGKESVKSRREKYGDAQPRSKPEPPLRSERTHPSNDTEAASKPNRTPPSEAPKPMPSMPSSPAMPKAKAGERKNASASELAACAPAPSEAGRETKSEQQPPPPPLPPAPKPAPPTQPAPRKPQRFRGTRKFPEGSIEELATQAEFDRLHMLKAAVLAYSTRDPEKHAMAVLKLARYRALILERLDAEGLSLHPDDEPKERAAALALVAASTENVSDHEEVTDGDRP